jgi:Tol biopolymer transport system component
MPDVREIFDSTTKELQVQPQALERQHRRQRRHRTVERTTIVVVVTCVAVAAGSLLVSAWPLHQRQLARPSQVTSMRRPYLVTVNPDSGVAGNGLVGRVAPDSRAAISPDGSRIAFARSFGAAQQIFVTTADGGATRLTGPGKGGCGCGASQPAWSPDGQQIAFAGIDEAGTQSIYVVNVATGRLSRVDRSNAFEAEPAWSPDGRKIAFTRGGHNGQSLWVARVAGGHEWRVSNLQVHNPAWSPDGRTIAFSSAGTPAQHVGLWVVQPDGSGLRRLASAAVESDGNLSWSPDGSEIVFAALRSGGQPPHVDIDVVNVSTGEVRVLAKGLDYPSWSPDGRSILALRP